jgi:hypothetical protein
MLFSQVWKHPYKAMGLVYSTTSANLKSKDLTRKEIEVDSSSNGVYKTYREYNSKGKIVVEVYENEDTVRYDYVMDDYWSQKIIRNDTIRQIVNRKPDGKIDNIRLLKKNKTYTTSYRYDQNGNIVEVYSDSILYDQCEYDSLNRIVQVKNFRSGYLSNIIQYRYEKDTIYYTECPYNEKGERYSWPCEEIKGVYNDAEQISTVISILHETKGPVTDILTFKYDKKGRIVEITDSLSNGNYGRSIWFYKGSNLQRFEHFSNGQLVRKSTYIKIE